MNSIRVHYSRENWSTTTAKKKKAENGLELKMWTWTCIQTDTKCAFGLE